MMAIPDAEARSRHALIVATTTYDDPGLQQLRAPAEGAAILRSVLGDPAIGGFHVTTLTDRSAHDLKVRLERFLVARAPEDLLLLYISGHGVRDVRGRLYFAAVNTETSALAATGVESTWLLERLDECRAKSQVVLLDCCFSGAFAMGAMAAEGSTDHQLRSLVGHGRGRFVLTASRATEHAYEGHVLSGAALSGSIFTAGIAAGLINGDADFDQDGLISVEDAFQFAYEFVQRHDTMQTPQRWSYGVEGTIWLARNRHHAFRPEPDVSVRRLPERRPLAKVTPRTLPARHPTPGVVVGWGGRTDGYAKSIATAAEFGLMVPPAGINDAIALSAGRRHVLALLADGTVRMWGDGTHGQIKAPRRMPLAIAVAAGDTHSLALARDGLVVGWGNNEGGQVRTPPHLTDVVAVAAGGWHSLALRRDGTVAAWGENRFGQTAVPVEVRTAVAIAAGAEHSVALLSDGRVVAWGRSHRGQVRVPPTAREIVAVAAAGNHCVALRRSGETISWGDIEPLRHSTQLTAVAAGDQHCLGLDSTGRIVAWGNNEYGQCVPPPGIGHALAVDAGGLFSVAIVAPEL